MSITCIDTGLNILGNLCAVITAGVAIWYYCSTNAKKANQVKNVEDYLKDEKAKGVDKGQRTVLHLVRELGMSQDEIWQACLSSKKIKPVGDTDKAGFTNRILFHYVED